MTVKVLDPEDIIGLKAQSIVNNPERAVKDSIDIETIIKINRDNLDMARIRDAFRETERKYLDWLKKHPGYRSLDNYITFLNSIKKVFGPFPISKDTPTPPYDFRL